VADPERKQARADLVVGRRHRQNRIRVGLAVGRLSVREKHHVARVTGAACKGRKRRFERVVDVGAAVRRKLLDKGLGLADIGVSRGHSRIGKGCDRAVESDH